MRPFLVGLLLGILLMVGLACTEGLLEPDYYENYRDSLVTRSQADTISPIDSAELDTVKINVAGFENEVGGAVIF